MRVVFLGSGAFGLPTLERLSQSHEVVGVVTQPDQRAGRGKKMTPTPIGAWAAEHLSDVPLIKPENINTDETRELVRSWDCDAWVVIAFGQKLGEALLADRFAINLHASLLPRWRGAAPINHAILAGDTVTGNSVITLADRMDAGLVLGQSERAIGADQTKDELHDLLAQDGPALIERVLQQHATGTLEPVVQDESRVTLAGKLSRADSPLNWDAPPTVVARRINGLAPWPAATSTFRGKPIKLLKSRPIENEEQLEPHSLPRWMIGLPMLSQSEEHWAKVREANGYRAGVIVDGLFGLVWTRGGVVQILEIQPAGKPAMSWKAFSNGAGLRKFRRVKEDSPAFETGTPG